MIEMIEYDSPRTKAVRQKPAIGTVIFASRSDAEMVLYDLFEEASFFNRASLETFYRSCWLTYDDEDKAIGWTKDEVNKARIGAMRHIGYTEYYIDIAAPHKIKPIKDYSVLISQQKHSLL